MRPRRSRSFNPLQIGSTLQILREHTRRYKIVNGFNPLQIGSTLQLCRPRSRRCLHGRRFNPLQIGSTLQTSGASNTKIAKFCEFQSPTNRVNTSNQIGVREIAVSAVMFQSPTNRVNTSNVIRPAPQPAAETSCFNPLQIGSTLQILDCSFQLGVAKVSIPYKSGQHFN